MNNVTENVSDSDVELKDDKSLIIESEEFKKWIRQFPVYSQDDFNNTACDDRLFDSGIKDIIGGESFDRHWEEFKELCEEIDYFDSVY